MNFYEYLSHEYSYVLYLAYEYDLHPYDCKISNNESKKKECKMKEIYCMDTLRLNTWSWTINFVPNFVSLVLHKTLYSKPKD
jgi:hypothetical protein